MEERSERHKRKGRETGGEAAAVVLEERVVERQMSWREMTGCQKCLGVWFNRSC